MATMTVEKLVGNADAYMRRMRRQYNQLKKIHKIKDEDELEVIAGLRVSYQLLARRFQKETLLFAQEEHLETLSHQEKQDHRARSKEIFDLVNMAFKARELAQQMLQDCTEEIKSSVNSSDTNLSLIEDAKKALAEMQFGFELDDKQHEVIECQTPQSNN